MFVKVIIIALTLMSLANTAHAQGTFDPVQSVFSRAQVEEIPLALGGKDPVSYFVKNQAETGIDIYQAVYQGQRFLFSSAEHQEMFSKDPERFLPEFGGYCAHSMSEDKVVEADPNLFLVANNKLYLFSKPEAVTMWSSQPVQSLAKAEKNWSFKPTKLTRKNALKKSWATTGKVTLFTF